MAWTSLLLLGMTPAAWGQAPSAAASRAAGHSPSAHAATAASQPEQPPAPPQVTLRDGLLSIHAQDSTLADVLQAVQRATGATIDTPGNVSERVYVDLGPGEPRNVLATLLNGSRYDYILLGSQQQPNSVSRVMLTVRQNIPDQPVSAAHSATPPPPDNDNDEDESTAAEEPPDRANQPPKNTPANPPNGQPPQPNAANAANASQQPGQTGVKTPEELLHELQQLQQQQQQQLQLQQQLQQQNNFGH